MKTALRPVILPRGASGHWRADVDTRERMVARRRFTAEEYHKMGEAGILGEDDRVELIEGEVVEMAPIGSRHAMCVIRLNRLLVSLVGDEAFVSPQNPVSLDPRQEPQPDLAVLRARDYKDSLPGPEDVLFLIEVSDTTLRYDQEIKLPLYARSGILEVWIMDLAGGAIKRHNEPSGDGYRRTERARRGDGIRSEVFPNIFLRAADVLT